MSSLRQHTRVPLEVEVTLESDDNFWTGITNDISQGGLFVAMQATPAIGEQIELSLKMPGEPIAWRITGVVRWLRDLRASSEGCPPGCGVQFVGLAPEVLLGIMAFVRQRDTLFYDYEDAA